MILEKFIIFILLGAFSAFLYASQRYLFWGISFSRRNFSGLIFICAHFVFLIPGMFMILRPNPSDSWVIFVLSDGQTAFFADLIILLGLFLFVFFSVLLSHAIGPSAVYNGNQFVQTAQNPSTIAQYQKLLNALCLTTLFALAAILLLTSTQHALLSGWISGLAPGALRHMNSESALGGLLNLFMQIYTLLIAILCGIPKVIKSRLYGVMVAITIVLAATLHGDKAPVIMALLVFMIVRMHFSKKVNFMRVFRRLALLAGCLFALLSIMIKFYFKDLELAVLDYFTGRILLGQTAGFYDQIALKIQNINYALHGIPFFSLVGEPHVFHKDLMLISEGRTDPSSIGIKNTLFLAEAYAIFGVSGYVLGPFIMALGGVTVFITMSRVFRHFFHLPLDGAKAIAAMFFVIYFQLTDGVTELMFGKSLVLILIALSPVYVIYAYFPRVRIRRTQYKRARI